MIVLLSLTAASAAVSFADVPMESPAESRRLYNDALRFIAEGYWTKAERSLLEALKIDPKNYVLYHGLGLVYAQTAEYGSAEYYFSEAVRLQPNARKSLYALAKIHVRMGEYKKAEEDFMQVIALDPKDLKARHDLSGLYYNQERWDDAIKVLIDTIATQDESAQTLTLLGVAAIRADRSDILIDVITRLKAIGEDDQARKLENTAAYSRYQERVDRIQATENSPS